jgi:hypothetical protein
MSYFALDARVRARARAHVHVPYLAAGKADENVIPGLLGNLGRDAALLVVNDPRPPLGGPRRLPLLELILLRRAQVGRHDGVAAASASDG